MKPYSPKVPNFQFRLSEVIPPQIEAGRKMSDEKRKDDNSIPKNLEEVLNQKQRLTLRRMEGFGWQLQFIRRPLFQEPTVVVCDAAGIKIGVLESDGNINMTPEIDLRE